MSSIVAFHIGPVQGFIATARRTQDLWIGSWLLSYLAREAIGQFQREVPGAILLAPSAPPGDVGPIADTPNHFVVSLPGVDGTSVATSVEKAVRERFAQIGKNVRDFFLSYASTSVDNDLWDRQINSALEVFWIALPDTVPAPRDAAYAALASRKALRDFSSVAEPGFKCSQCGLRQELSGAANRDSARS